MSIEIRNISFGYEKKRLLFSNISLTVNPGEIVSILGPNGAGKTTLLSCIACLLEPTAGEVFIDGKKARKMSAREIAKKIGFVPQTIVPSFSFSVLEYVVTGCAPSIGTFDRPQKHHYDAALAAIDQMGIRNLSDRSCMNISGGEKQQVAIARVLAQKPQIILLDEPTAHLDYGNQIKVLKTIRSMASQGFGIVLTTHNPDHVLLLNGKIAVLDKNGKLTFGDVDDIINERFLTNLYGTDLNIIEVASLRRKACLPPSLS